MHWNRSHHGSIMRCRLRHRHCNLKLSLRSVSNQTTNWFLQAYFYTPFTQLGLCIEGAASYTFPKILGTSKTAEVLLLNHKMAAEEALKFKFVSEVFKPAELQAVLWPRIESFAKLPKASVTVGKKLLRNFELDKLERARKEEAAALNKITDSGEFKKATLNFLNRKSKL